MGSPTRRKKYQCGRGKAEGEVQLEEKNINVVGIQKKRTPDWKLKILRRSGEECIAYLTRLKKIHKVGLVTKLISNQRQK